MHDKSPASAPLGVRLDTRWSIFLNQKVFFQSSLMLTTVQPCSFAIFSEAVNPCEDFVILKDDPIKDPRILQDSIFAKMRRASFHVMLNKDGYIGHATTLELG